MKLGVRLSIHRVDSALKMGKEGAHENQASVNGPGAELLRGLLKVERPRIGWEQQLAKFCLAGVGDIFCCQSFSPVCWFSDLWVVPLEPSACHEQRVAHLTPPSLIVGGGLLVKSTDPGKPSRIDCGIVLPERRQMRRFLLRPIQKNRFVQDSQRAEGQLHTQQRPTALNVPSSCNFGKQFIHRDQELSRKSLNERISVH